MTVLTDRKIKRKRKGGGIVSIVTEPEDNLYAISFKRRGLNDKTSVPFGYKEGRVTGEWSVYTA